MESNIIHQIDAPLAYPKNALIEKVPFDTYQKMEGLNASGMKTLFNFTEEHYYEERFNGVEKKETDAQRFGFLLHAAVLEPEYFLNHYAVEPEADKRTSAGKNIYRDWIEKQKADALIINKKEYDQLMGILDKLSGHSTASRLLGTGLREVSMWWTDPITDILCKGRPDAITSHFDIVDIKTCKDARPQSFFSQVDRLCYDLQAAHYIEGLKAIGKNRNPEFIWIAIEKEPPYALAVYPASIPIIDGGFKKARIAIAKYKKAKETGVWPGYNQDFTPLIPPEWYLRKLELMESEEME